MLTEAKWTAALLSLALGFSACASMPDLTASYYLPRTSVSVHVVRTFACNSAKVMFTTSTVTAVVTHAADLDKRRAIALRRLDGTFSDTDIELELYEDGRLKGLNSSTTGEAEATIKPLATAIASAFGATQHTPETEHACSAGSEATKPTTLTFTHDVDFSDVGGKTSTGAERTTSDQVIDPDPDSEAIFAKVHDALGYTCIRIEKLTLKPSADGHPVLDIPALENTTDADSNIELQLQQPARVALKVWSSKDHTCAFKSDTKLTWSGQSEVAQIGTLYNVPISKAAMFGKLQLSLAVAESGAVTTLKYAKQAAAPSIATAGQDLSAHVAPETAAQKAADLKAESDVIAQQQRLVRCRVDPKTCS